MAKLDIDINSITFMYGHRNSNALEIANRSNMEMIKNSIPNIPIYIRIKVNDDCWFDSEVIVDLKKSDDGTWVATSDEGVEYYLLNS